MSLIRRFGQVSGLPIYRTLSYDSDRTEDYCCYSVPLMNLEFKFSKEKTSQLLSEIAEKEELDLDSSWTTSQKIEYIIYNLNKKYGLDISAKALSYDGLSPEQSWSKSSQVIPWVAEPCWARRSEDCVVDRSCFEGKNLTNLKNPFDRVNHPDERKQVRLRFNTKTGEYSLFYRHFFEETIIKTKLVDDNRYKDGYREEKEYVTVVRYKEEKLEDAVLNEIAQKEGLCLDSSWTMNQKMEYVVYNLDKKYGLSESGRFKIEGGSVNYKKLSPVASWKESSQVRPWEADAYWRESYWKVGMLAIEATPIDKLNSDFSAMKSRMQNEASSFKSHLQNEASSLKSSSQDEVSSLKSSMQNEVSSFKSRLQNEVSLWKTLFSKPSDSEGSLIECLKSRIKFLGKRFLYLLGIIYAIYVIWFLFA